MTTDFGSAPLSIDEFVAFMLRTQEAFYKSFNIRSNRLDFYFCIISVIENGIDEQQNGDQIYRFINSNEIRGGITSHRVKERLVELGEMGMLQATVEGQVLTKELANKVHALSRIDVISTEKFKDHLGRFIGELKDIEHPILISFEGKRIVRCFNLMWRRLRAVRADLIERIIEDYNQALKENGHSLKEMSIDKGKLKAKLQLSANFWYMLFFIWAAYPLSSC